MIALNTVQAGERLGGLSHKDVCTLIRKGLLKAKKLVVRGRGGKPRYLILDTAIDDYLDGLPEAGAANAPNTGKAAKARAPRKGETTGVIQFVRP